MMPILTADINVKVLDSRDDRRYTYFIVDDCKFMALKTRLNDECYIMELVNNECRIKLDTDKNCKGKK